MTGSFWTITEEELTSADATSLIAELNEFLDGLYPPEDNFFSLPSADCFLIARDEGGLAVACGALRVHDGFGEIKRMWVRPHARRNGLARRMLNRLEEHARSLGVSELRLETGNRQPDAISLYVSSGWTEIPLFGEYVTSGTSVCYAKRLD